MEQPQERDGKWESKVLEVGGLYPPPPPPPLQFMAGYSWLESLHPNI